MRAYKNDSNEYSDMDREKIQLFSLLQIFSLRRASISHKEY